MTKACKYATVSRQLSAEELAAGVEVYRYRYAHALPASRKQLGVPVPVCPRSSGRRLVHSCARAGTKKSRHAATASAGKLRSTYWH